jgi:ribonuclease P protein component
MVSPMVAAAIRPIRDAATAVLALTCTVAPTIRARIPEKCALCWGLRPGDVVFCKPRKNNSNMPPRPYTAAALRDLDGDFREAHLSTEPPCSQAPPWISQAHADGRWPEGSGPSSLEGPQASFGLIRSSAKAPLPLLAALEAVIPILPTLKARSEFLAVRGGRRSSTPAFLIEMRERPGTTVRGGVGPRFGFTITKKIGNAVTRNRIRRRLKAAFAAETKDANLGACDYVVVARHAALDRPFTLLLGDVSQAMAALHRSKPARADKKGSA